MREDEVMMRAVADADKAIRKALGLPEDRKSELKVHVGGECYQISYEDEIRQPR